MYMVNLEEIKIEVLNRLAPLKPEKVILFGSYAAGSPTAESDIDLYIVTKDNFIPQSFKENSEIKLKVSQSLFDFRMKYPVDLIVHTLPMHRKFIKENSSLAREIQQKGVHFL